MPHASSLHTRPGVRDLTPSEAEKRERGRLRGVEHSPVTGEFDIEPFRRAFEQSGLTLSELARLLGYWRPDQPRVGRMLGYYRDHGRYHRQVTYKSAVDLCRVLHLDPVDVDL